MKRKSLIVSILSALLLVIGNYAGFLDATWQAWLGVVAIAANLVLSTWFPSGTIVKGWTWVMWVTSVSAIVIQILNAISAASFLTPEITNAIIIGINIVIQVFVKDYSDPVTPTKTTA